MKDKNDSGADAAAVDGSMATSADTVAPHVAPIRVQRQRSRGWRMPANTVYVGRPTRWGNPFEVSEGVTRKP